jgi:peptide/nickel transport system permease protein
MGESWVRTARAIGASSRELLWRHVLPNALLSTLALLGVQFAFLLSGSLVIESLYAWPGMGQLLIESVRAVDFPVVQAAVFVIAVLVFGVSAAVDLLLPALDPRLRSPAP